VAATVQLRRLFAGYDTQPPKRSPDRTATVPLQKVASFGNWRSVVTGLSDTIGLMPTRRMKCRVSSLPGFVSWVEEVESDWTTDDGLLRMPFFRGVGDSDFGLVPGLYRRAETRDLYVDWKLRSEFVRQAGPLVVGDRPKDCWDWYCLMQHYGMPTRLLDWTEGALVALHFALRLAVPGKLPAVWALNPWFLNAATSQEMHVLRVDDLRKLSKFGAYLSDEDVEGRLVPELPIAFAPTIIDTRMLGQRSYFTLHGSDARGLESIPKLKPLVQQGHLRKAILELDDDDIKRMKMTLATLGISEVTVFPDISGLARQVVSDFSGL
jgi:hypothetical protein